MTFSFSLVLIILNVHDVCLTSGNSVFAKEYIVQNITMATSYRKKLQGNSDTCILSDFFFFMLLHNVINKRVKTILHLRNTYTISSTVMWG